MPSNINIVDKEGWKNLDILLGATEIASIFGKKLISCHELRGGLISKVLKLKIETQNIVVKVSPLWYPSSLSREDWCYNKLRNECNVRIPQVYFYLNSNNHIFPRHEILVMEFIKGKLASDITRNLTIHKEVASIYKRIHSIPLNGYGWLDDHFNGKKKTWIDFLIDIDKIEAALEKRLIEKNEYDWIVNEISSVYNLEFTPKLLHGDFRWQNFILSSKGVVIIDFQNCFSGHELYDYGIGLIYDPNLLCYLKYYFENTIILKKNYMKILLYGMRHAMSVIGFLADRMDINYAHFIRERYYDLKREYERMCISESTIDFKS